MNPTYFKWLLISVFACSSLAPFANGGECPKDKIGKNNLSKAPDRPNKIQIDELASLDLASEAPKLKQWRLRIRTITFAPGGYVPLHSHDKRPALAIVTEGELQEHTTHCKEPIVQRTGDVIVENKGVTHWVVNKGTATAVLTVSDMVDERDIKSRFK